MKIKVFLTVAIWWIMVCASSSAQAMGEVSQILILHSYTADYQWTGGLHQGIKDRLTALSPETHSRVEFMDTKNYYSPDYFDRLARLYRDKYGHMTFDAVLVTDNNALEFMTSYGAELFPDVPVVACGINDVSPEMVEGNVRVVIAEVSDHLKTVEQALKLQPDARTIYVIYDETPTGARIAREVKASLDQLNHPARPILVTGKTLDELKRFVATRNKLDLVYLVPFFRDASGSTFQQGEVGRKLAAVSTVPLIASWEFQIGSGLLGGYVLLPQLLGAYGAETVLKLLSGVPVDPLPSSPAFFTSVYDDKVLQRYKLDKRKLPADAVILNTPVKFYEQHREVLNPAFLLVALMGLIALLFYLRLKQQQAAHLQEQNLRAEDRETIATQQELVRFLGEVIEARSQETGQHVLRVAKLSRFLGQQAGLDMHQLDLLESASPMHDIGKIGIPEHILYKREALTEKEYEVIKSHTTIGRDLLQSSDRELMKVAAIIAYQHHERWDGSGYPTGLQGEEIDIRARITILVDVYDALSSDRAYKEAWPEEKVFNYIRAERGKYFDPGLVDIFFENLDQMRSIRMSYSNI